MPNSTPSEAIGSAAESVENSRWVRVLRNWDYRPTRRVTLAFRAATIEHRPESIVAAGVAAGAFERIAKPAGYTVDKAGNVVVP